MGGAEEGMDVDDERGAALDNGMSVNMLQWCIHGLRIKFQLRRSGDNSPQSVSPRPPKCRRHCGVLTRKAPSIAPRN